MNHFKKTLSLPAVALLLTAVVLLASCAKPAVTPETTAAGETAPRNSETVTETVTETAAPTADASQTDAANAASDTRPSLLTTAPDITFDPGRAVEASAEEIAAVYRAVLDAEREKSAGAQGKVRNYTVYDIDDDGVPELIFEVVMSLFADREPSAADGMLYYFTCDGENAIPLRVTTDVGYETDGSFTFGGELYAGDGALYRDLPGAVRTKLEKQGDRIVETELGAETALPEERVPLYRCGPDAAIDEAGLQAIGME